MQLSPEQQSIIKHRGQNLLVSAAAGSGKTRVLVERILHLLINERCSLENMLVVTFTNAAAAEMKSRISVRLNDAVEALGSDSSSGLASCLVKELNQLGQAQISTLHSFCNEIVRTHFFSIGIDPAFRVADGAESEILKREALEEILEDFSQEAPDEMLAVLDMFSTPFSDQGLQNLLLRLHGYIMSRPDPWIWLDEKVAALDLKAEELPGTVWFRYLAAEARRDLQESQVCYLRALELCRDIPELRSLQAFLSAESSALADLLTAAEAEELFRRLQDFTFGRRPAISRKIGAKLAGALAEARDQGKEMIMRAQSLVVTRSFARQAEEYALMQPHLEFLRHMLQAYDRCYWNKKQEKGLLDFSDLEHKALEALRVNDCAAAFRQRFEYVFVDEYQDTSPIQEALLSLISREDNLFMVGDVKQGIYRFRLADPAIFLARYHGYETGEGGCLRLLDRNYRSGGGIIEAVNGLFSVLMTEQHGEIDYCRNMLRAGRTPESDPAPVELLLLDSADNGIESAPAGSGDTGSGADSTGNDGTGNDGSGDAGSDAAALLEDMQKAEKEAWMVAGRIRRLVEGQETVADTAGYQRPARYRDICILMRATAGVVEVFSQVFKQAGIPLYAEASGGYFESLEIQLVLNLLRLIDNRRQDLALVSVMHAPFFSFSLADLTAIRILGREAPAGDASFYAAVEYCAASGPPELAARIASMLQRLEQWREEARFMNLDQFIWKLLMESGFYYYAAAMPGGRQRTANLDLLLAKARSFEASSLKGLFNFIGFVDRLRAGGQDGGAAPLIGENADVVRIMSIHKSKGLEFPVVVVAGLGRRFNTRDSSERMLLHGEMGLGPYFIDTEKRVFTDTLARTAISHKLRRESQAEEMRVLYVAMTRAESRLILCGHLTSLERSVGKWQASQLETGLRQANSYLDWIGPVLLRLEKSGRELRQRYGVEMAPGALRTEGDQWKAVICRPVEIMEQAAAVLSGQAGCDRGEMRPAVPEWPGEAIPVEPERPPLDAECSPLRDPRLLNIKRALAWQYPYGEAAAIPSKLSVTSVKRFLNPGQVEQEALKEMARPVVFNRPRLAADLAPAALTGAEAGTVNHLVLQLLDLSRVGSTDQISRQLEEMINREILSPAEAAAVNPQTLSSFYESRLGQRLLQSPASRREVPFNLKIRAGELFGPGPGQDEEMLLQGVIDLFFQEEGQVVLVDYKSDRPGRSPEEILESYSLQVDLYRRALEQIQQQPVKDAYIYMLATGESIAVKP